MGQNLTLNPVLEWGDDRPSVGVIFRIGREDKLNVKGEPHLETPDLDVSLLKDVEEGHLNARLQVGQLVDGKNATVTARDESKVQGARIAVIQPFIGEVSRSCCISGTKIPSF